MKISPLRTSAFRLALGYAVFFTLAVSALLGTIYLLTQHELAGEQDAVITAELEGLTDEYQRGGTAALLDGLAERADSWGRTGTVYLLASPDLVKEGGNLGGWPFEGVPHRQWTQFSIKARRANDQIVLHPVRAKLVRLPDQHWLLVGLDLAQQRRFAARFRTATLWGIGLTALAGALAGHWLSRRLTRRMQRVTASCDAIIRGDLSRRLPLSGSGDEFDGLAQAVNRVLDRLEENAQLLRATFDSAAHDLRAPLYRLRTRLEDALRTRVAGEELRAEIDTALQDLDHVQRTLATLLQIARAESDIAAVDSAPVDLGALVRDMVELYEPAARERGLGLTMRMNARCTVRGNRQLLAQAVANLIENSLKYVPAGGHIEVGTRRHGAQTQLVVADDGPGIPAAEHVRVLQPFVRLPAATAHSGSGLGLSLVAAIARLHRARLTLGDNAPGLWVALSFAAGGTELAPAPQPRGAELERLVLAETGPAGIEPATVPAGRPGRAGTARDGARSGGIGAEAFGAGGDVTGTSA